MRCAVVVMLCASCAPAAPEVLTMTNPQALVSCEAPPSELNARMWISGQAAPCALAVDVAANTTSGSCDVVPGVVRRLTIDWYVPLDRDDGLDLVLAQAQGEIDLQQAENADESFALTDDQIRITDCLDMRKDTFNGADTVLINGADAPLCDLDESGIVNVDEVCAGADPLDAGSEP